MQYVQKEKLYMPTTTVKNFLYRIALPFLAPRIPADLPPVCAGRTLNDPDILFSIIRRNHISGAAVMLKDDSEESTCYSSAVHTDFVPDSNTYFRVASITKMATALIAAILADRGFLDPDAPLSYYLPDGSRIKEIDDILVRHLLSHTSGLSDPPDLENMLLCRRPWSEAVAGRKMNKSGTVFRYSNLGFGLLGCVFEAITDMPLEDIYQHYLFIPLGMNATMTGASLDPLKIMPVIRILPYKPGCAVTVTKLGNKFPGGPDPSVHYGYSAGSMYTDLPSLMKMMICIRDNCRPLISSGYGEFMKKETAGYGKISPTLSYGSGMLIIRDKRISDSSVFGHQGFAYGCVDGAFWEDSTGRIMISLNGGCSEARTGRIGVANLELCRWAFRREMPGWKS